MTNKEEDDEFDKWLNGDDSVQKPAATADTSTESGTEAGGGGWWKPQSLFNAAASSQQAGAPVSGFLSGVAGKLKQRLDEQLADFNEEQQKASENAVKTKEIDEVFGGIADSLKKQAETFKEESMAALNQEKSKIDNHLEIQSQIESGTPPWTILAERYGILEDDLRARILELHQVEETFLVAPKTDDYEFEYKTMLPTGRGAMKEDPQLGNMRFQLVPTRVDEVGFWRNYFYHVSMLRDAIVEGHVQHNSSMRSQPTSQPSTGLTAPNPQPSLAKSAAAPAVGAAALAPAPSITCSSSLPSNTGAKTSSSHPPPTQSSPLPADATAGDVGGGAASISSAMTSTTTAALGVASVGAASVTVPSPLAAASDTKPAASKIPAADEEDLEAKIARELEADDDDYDLLNDDVDGDEVKSLQDLGLDSDEDLDKVLELDD